MRKTFASRAVGLLPFFLVLGPSCSLVYDLSPDQCSTNSDCDHFGPGMVCNSGVCACGIKSLCGSGVTGGTGADGGTGGTLFGGTGGTNGGSGGTVTGGTGGDAGALPEVGGSSAVGGTGGAGGSTGGKGGSTSKGGTSGKGGSGTTGGDAGAAGMTQGPECATHNDCFLAHPDDSDANPRACVDGTCVPLKSEDCPVVLPISDNGRWNALKSTDAIILGGFAPISGVSIDTLGRNYDLALSEFSQKTGGVLSGSPKRHELVMVLCNWNYDVQEKLLAPAKHLMEELQVPGVVATLLLQDQHYVWENVGHPNGTFMIQTLYSDQALIDEPDDGLLWHELSGANDLSVSYQPLFDMVVDHLKMNAVLGATESVKVSHVEATDEPFLHDTSLYLDANLQINGASTTDNLNADPKTYDAMSVTSSYTDPTDTQATAIARILSFKPHIVIGSTKEEMLKYIIPGVESGWDGTTQSRPFYILGALDYNDTQMSTLIRTDHSTTATPPQTPLNKRILGVNWPSALDQSVNQAYQARWNAVYNTPAPGYENFYDPVWYLMYGIAAARVPITGSGIVAGLKRVITTTSGTPVVDVGPSDDLATYVTALSQSSKQKIELVGAMGPPAWDEFGGRTDPASIWCLDSVGNYYSDQMRYDAGPPATLTGKIDPVHCFTFDGMQ